MCRLAAHGFLDISLNSDYSNVCDIVPRTAEIARLGPEQQINGDAWRFLTRGLEEPGRLVGWNIGELYREGTYGKIYKGSRMVVDRRADGLYEVAESPTEVVVKQTVPPAGSRFLPVEDITAHTSEALLHILAWNVMQDTAAPWAIPQPYEVFGDCSGSELRWESMSFCMSYVHGRTLYSYIKKHWRESTKAANTRAFLEILGQTAYILHHLQRRLRLNHRDVKVNNILIRRRVSPLELELGGVQISTHYEVVLIDFGFACVGCPPPRVPNTVFQAGSWFPLGELCCKQGRDIAQLLFCIHCYFPLHQFLTHNVMEAVRRWMEIPWSGGVADALHGFTKEGRPRRSNATGEPEYNTGVYEFLRRADVDPASCAPQAIFRACAQHLSQVAAI
jgi:serine/threonine protein kinase